MELTAVNNPQVKAAAELKQKKYRQHRGLFLAEGLRTVEESVAYRQGKAFTIQRLRMRERALC